MNSGNAQYLLINYVRIKCPLCEDKFRQKVNFRVHLKKEHTDDEFESFVSKQEKSVEDKHNLFDKKSEHKPGENMCSGFGQDDLGI